MTALRICPVCGITFEATSPASRYCSKRCRSKAHNRREKFRVADHEIPADALDLADAFARLRFVANDFARIGACGTPEVRAISLRVTEGIAALLEDEGLL